MQLSGHPGRRRAPGASRQALRHPYRAQGLVAAAVACISRHRTAAAGSCCRGRHGRRSPGGTGGSERRSQHPDGSRRIARRLGGGRGACELRTPHASASRPRTKLLTPPSRRRTRCPPAWSSAASACLRRRVTWRQASESPARCRSRRNRECGTRAAGSDGCTTRATACSGTSCGARSCGSVAARWELGNADTHCLSSAQRSPVCSGVRPLPPRPHALQGTSPKPCAGDEARVIAPRPRG